MKDSKQLLRLKRKWRIRLKIHGSDKRPRLVIYRSLRNFYAQIIDDTQNKVLFSLSTLDKQIRKKFSNAGSVKTAESFGEIFAQRAKEKGISKIVFDRAGYLYHGRIKAFAEAVRKGGLEF